MENKILAKVGNVEITEEIVDRTIESLRPEQQQFFKTEEGRKQLVDQLINIELINAYGEKIGVKDSDLYKSQMERAQKDIMLNSTMSKVMEDVKVTDEDIEKELESNREKYQGNETIGAKHILVEDEVTAKKIKKELDENSISFEDAAVKYSTCPSSHKGGDLGQFGKGMMVKEFEDVALNAEIDTVTEPVKTQFGYHLIKVYEKGINKDSIRQQMLQEKQMIKYNEFVADLRKNSGF